MRIVSGEIDVPRSPVRDEEKEVECRGGGGLGMGRPGALWPLKGGE